MSSSGVRNHISQGLIPTIKIGKGKNSTIMINLAKLAEEALAREY